MKEEMVDIVDENDNVIDTVPRSVMRKKNSLHRGTSVFVENNKGELLIHKRTMTKDVFPGLYDTSFGGCVAAGETYKENAKRELEEEIGIKDANLKFLFKLRHDGKHTKVFFDVFSVVSEGPFKFQEEEVEKAFFVSKENLSELIEKEKFKPTGLKLLDAYLKHKNETI